MPRTLPWLKDPDGESPVKPSVKRRRVQSTPPSSPDILAAVRTPNLSRRNTHLRASRSPSTSPPPAPLSQEFMRPGWDNDDIWRMVTDEFTATAQLFTAHLAHAEYQRQKKLARQREDALGGADAIVRPVVGKLSKEGQARKQKELHRANVRDVLGNNLAEKEDEEWTGTQLAGLITSPRKRERLRARNMEAGRSNTRAAAGFDRARPQERARPPVKENEARVETPHSSLDDEDEDLDAALPSRPSSPTRRNPANRHQHSARKVSPTQSKPKDDIFKPFSKPKVPPQPAGSATINHRSASQSLNKTSRALPKAVEREPSPPAIKPEPGWGFPSIPQPTKTGSSVLARRREARLKREKEEREKEKMAAASQIHELPTFLF